jgi:hypothetical protein
MLVDQQQLGPTLTKTKPNATRPKAVLGHITSNPPGEEAVKPFGKMIHHSTCMSKIQPLLDWYLPSLMRM